MSRGRKGAQPFFLRAETRRIAFGISGSTAASAAAKTALRKFRLPHPLPSLGSQE